MVTVAYDPVAKELIIDYGPGTNPTVVRAERLFAKLYGEGYLGCEIDGQSIDLFFEAAEEAPVVMMVHRITAGHWCIRFLSEESG